jgi:S-adenosylmethionine:tRNA ribosyltransferase-isomerase
MRVADFHFNLPEELIAQSPPEPRGSSRMLVLDRASGQLTDDLFANLPQYLRKGDLLLLNDSRVIPARLFAVRAGLHTQSGSPEPRGRIEVLLTRQLGADLWTVLVRPSRKVVVGETLHFFDPAESTPLLEAEVIAAAEFGERTLRFAPKLDFFAVLDRIGRIPLPPYIQRDPTQQDRERYQTVVADQPGSAAAPTAGLHITPEMLAALKAQGVAVETITLHVGLGTFQPVRVEDLADIRLHEERYAISQTASDAIATAYREGGRIVAVGTTTARTLEGSVAEQTRLYKSGGFHGRVRPHTGTTSIFLAPGHRFQVVTGLLTNFHLPQSTLLMLVSAFAGREAVLAAYAHAVEQRYRFFSYGDCMLLL